MIDYRLAYDIIYALAAKDGREQRLFGQSAPFARVAFDRSLAGRSFPELWFEVPLAGDPWFDLHALTSCGDLDPDKTFLPDETGGNPELFAWFAKQDPRISSQLALSYDVSRGDVNHPATQLLITQEKPQMTCEFLEAAGKPETAPAFRAFLKRLPDGWFACYAGVFAGRPAMDLRVECIPKDALQRAYAKDPELLASHLRMVGLTQIDDELLARCAFLADTPFQLEFQFNVDLQGRATETLGVSLRFAWPPGTPGFQAFDPDAATGDLMRRIEEWGLADDRWRLLADATYAHRLSRGDQYIKVFCYPTFVKLRWRDAEPVDAKAYLIAGVQ